MHALKYILNADALGIVRFKWVPNSKISRTNLRQFVSLTEEHIPDMDGR